MASLNLEGFTEYREFHKQRLRVVHTSAATVIVLPEAEEFDIELLASDIKKIRIAHQVQVVSQ